MYLLLCLLLCLCFSLLSLAYKKYIYILNLLRGFLRFSIYLFVAVFVVVVVAA